MMINMMNRTGSSNFRQRGYTCSGCGSWTLTFGNDADPVLCTTCGKTTPEVTLEKKWDHQVETVTIVKDTPQDS